MSFGVARAFAFFALLLVAFFALPVVGALALVLTRSVHVFMFCWTLFLFLFCFVSFLLFVLLPWFLLVRSTCLCFADRFVLLFLFGRSSYAAAFVLSRRWSR